MATVIPIHMTDSQQPLKLSRLLQLCSANLPVGGFSFSQGLEYAVEMGWINNAASTESWVAMNLSVAIAHNDLAILKHLHRSLTLKDGEAFQRWNEQILASRESYELHMADVAMGKALMRLLDQLDAADMTVYSLFWQRQEISFVSAFAIAAQVFGLDVLSAQSGYCWTYLDNQIAAATKLVPLGQTQSQNLLFNLSEQVELAIQTANALEDDEIGASMPHLAMASAWHETQYTRLFRS
ncbi:urease accessory UreF family protein [Alteromonadaceae bacterium BrNp21-10]|nr:urease accessory UreF family protein [Alteromonadaceae bacterium BrNp21-10]